MSEARFRIELQALRFFAAHGMYAEEKKVGNDFEVDLHLETPAPETPNLQLEQTVDYVEVYEIVEEVFRTEKALLETCAMLIAEKVKARFPQVLAIEVAVRKLAPPITRFSGSVCVTYKKTYS